MNSSDDPRFRKEYRHSAGRGDFVHNGPIREFQTALDGVIRTLISFAVFNIAR